MPVFSICHILVALCMDETQMYMYVRGWYVHEISSLSVCGLIHNTMVHNMCSRPATRTLRCILIILQLLVEEGNSLR